MRRASLALALLAVAGCDRMADQPKRTPYAALVHLSPDHRLPPPGTVARDAAPMPVPAVTAALLARGQERFGIYCTPCHGRTGSGDGMIVQRGFPHPPSFFEDRLLAAPAQHVYDVITHGYGVMYPYAARVAPADRWAIAAYIRALQASQHAVVADLPAAERAKLP